MMLILFYLKINSLKTIQSFFKDDKKFKEIIAARLMISIEKNLFCRVLVSGSINTNFGSNHIIYTDYCFLLRYEKDAYEAQCRILKNCR